MTFSITFTSPLTADDIALAQSLGGKPADGTGTTTTPPPATVDYFPTDPALAPFPSPENSQQIVLNGVVAGQPYLKDTLGRIHSLAVQNGATVYMVNSVVHDLTGSSSTAPGELIVRQGAVYIILSVSGIVQLLTPNGTVYSAALPPAFAPGTSSPGVPGLPPLAAAPTPSAVAPGSSGKVIACGVAHPDMPTFSAALATASAGDTIVIDPGLYHETPPAWLIPLHIIGTGVTIDATGMDASLTRQGKGLLVPDADCIIEGITITGVGLSRTEGADLTCAIRPDSGCGYLTLLRVNLHGNQNGLGMGGFVCYMTVTDCSFDGNGLPPGNVGNGFAHNIYVGGGGKLTLSNTTSTNPVGGHAVKSRCPEFYMTGGTVDASDATAIDLPDGTSKPFTISGVTINKPAGAANHVIFGYAVESTTNGVAGGTVTGGSINALCDSPFILTGGGPITLSGVVKTGNPITVQGGGAVSGL